MPAPLPYRRKITITEPNIFIIESLHVDDEVRDRYEGRALRDALRISGHLPAYYYCRTKDELGRAIELFRHSSYRFLHLSMHGSISGVDTTLERLSNNEIAEMFDKKLNNRRVFFSACEVGSGGLSLLLRSRNPGMNSIACPLDTIDFGTACAFWLALYTYALNNNPLVMNAATLTPALQKLSNLFSVRLEWSYYDPHPSRRKWITQEIKAH